LYLRSLTIRGFKSFARKTILEFQPGVTIIVGPNGSGKSNIADAVMWVLGEQSPTSLRGNRMEDIIFSGSASLKPVNLAEVTLTLDNSNNIFPLEYSEITVSRNVVRGGDSEYRLNNNSCRLLDIQELLSDAGVGRTLNSVISQGQLDEVLTCRPEERRDYIEEAGGLLKYRRRREKALRRLTRMEEELVRTNDVMREVRRQLRPLQQQAGRLEKYQTLILELADSQLRLDVARLRMMQKDWQQHQDIQGERGKKLEALDAELAAKARAALDLEERQSGWREKEAGLRESLYSLVSMHERLKAMLTVWGEKSRRTVASVPAPDPEEIARLESSNREAQEMKQALENESLELLKREAQLVERVSELNMRLGEATRKVAALEARHEVLMSAESGLGAAGSVLLEEKREMLTTLENESATVASEMASLDETRAARLEELASLEAELEEIEKASQGAEDGLRACEREQAGFAATLELLVRLETHTWETINTMAALKMSDPTGGGLGGTLAESLKIEPEYDTAIMSFLGPWAFGLIARDGEAIMQAIKHLKDQGLGQSLFFRHLDARETAQDVEVPVPPATVRARDVVSAPEWFDSALDTLLDSVFIATDVEAAFELADQYPHMLFLSPDGDAISGGTLIKGGSVDVNPVHLELNASRREKTEDELQASRWRMDALELELQAAEKHRATLKGKTKEALSRLDDSTAELAGHAGTLDSLVHRIAAVKRDIEQLSGADDAETGSETDLSGLSASIEELKVLEIETRGHLEDAERERREVAGRSSSTAARQATVQRELESGLARERELKAAANAAREDTGGLEEASEAVIKRLVELNRRLVSQVRESREKVRQQLDQGAVKAEEEARTLRTLRDEVGKLQDRHEELRDQVHTEDLSRAELKIRVEQLVTRIVDGHKVPIEFALKQHPEEKPTPELEEKVEKLAARLEHIGPVNPEAITEREALEQRFDFLKTQLDDIEKSKTQLRRVVRQIDKEIEDKFVQTLALINEHFKDIFSTLFPNGSAELVMTDPEDPMNTGVEILAQPEGKKLRRISLLSGGETSLTALGFFFALFRVRPSPFYFLDEVEAALDDVNLHRFLDMVKQFKSESQLILITHQKRSMEIADILYGVTMQEDGVSRVVSQKLEEVAI